MAALIDHLMPADSDALRPLADALSRAPKQPSGAVVLRGAGPVLEDNPLMAAEQLTAAIKPRPAAQEIRAFQRSSSGVEPMPLRADRLGAATQESLSETLAAGGTVVLQKVDAFDFGWHRLARAFEGATAQLVQANIYAVAKATDGLAWHRDPHDVLIMQMSGSKHFLLSLDLVDGVPVGEEEVVMKAGDLMWMRRGTPHAVRSGRRGSLHASIGLLHCTRGSDGNFRRARDAFEPSLSPGHPALLRAEDLWPTLRALLAWRPLRPLPPHVRTAGRLRTDLILFKQHNQLSAGGGSVVCGEAQWADLKAGRLPRNIEGSASLAGGAEPARSFVDLTAFLVAERKPTEPRHA